MHVVRNNGAGSYNVHTSSAIRTVWYQFIQR